MRGVCRRSRLLAIWCVLSGLVLACTAGTEPSTNPRELRTESSETGLVSGRVLTSGTVAASGGPEEAEPGDSAARQWVKLGPVAGEAIRRSQTLAGVVVELGIVHFGWASDSVPPGTTRSMVVPFVVPDAWAGPFVVPDAWAGPEVRYLEPGPAEPPGRFEVIAQATTNGRGGFRFSKAPRGQMLMLRARPPAPYLETYSATPFLLGNRPAKVVDLVLRGGPR